MLFFLMVLGLVAVFAGVVRARIAREGLYSASFMFALGASMYFLSIPMERIAMGAYGIWDQGVFWIVDDAALYTNIYLTGLAAMVAFSLGLHGSGFVSFAPDRAQPDTHPNARFFELATLLLWASLILIMLVFFRDFFSVMKNSYTASYTMQYTRPIPTLILQLVAGLSAVNAVFLALSRKWQRMILAAILLASNFYLSLVLHQKTPGVFALFGAGYIYFSFVKNKKLALGGALAGICIAVFVLLPFYAIISNGDKSQTAISQYVHDYVPTFTAIDPSGPMGVTMIMANGYQDLQYGKTYIDSLGLFVPRALWPDRPPDIAEKFARDHMNNWQPGQGMGFGPLTEAYMNFGYFFSFIGFLLYGLFWGWAWRVIQKSLASYQSPAHVDVLYRVTGFFVMLQFFRGILIGNFKALLLHMVPVIIALYGMLLLMWLYRRYSGKAV